MRKHTVALNINGRKDEAIAAGIIVPGTLLERLSTGEVRYHSVQGGTAAALIAVEDRYSGKTIEDPYSVGDTVYMYRCLPGDIFYGWIDDPAIDPGDYVISWGDGRFGEATSPPYTSGAIVGVILEVYLQLEEPQRHRAVIEVM